jgi:hypothetical protein
VLGAVPSAHEIVPASLLERPRRDEARRMERDGAAQLLDPQLRRLASQEARCRRVLGTLGRELLRCRAYRPLGFVRIDDYARERLGLSGREVQSAARVVEGLEGLPALAAAFEEGALSWTQVRLLVPIARPETERAWVALAAGRTVRALEAVIRTRMAAASDPGDEPPAVSRAVSAGEEAPAAGGTAPGAPGVDPASLRAAAAALEECAEEGDLVDGEREVRFAIRCPRWVARLWREGVELARRVAGEPLALWRAAEAIAAEGLSAVPPSRAAAHGAPAAGGRAGADARGGQGSTTTTDHAFDPDETRDVFTRQSGYDTIDWSAVAEALPPGIEALGCDVAACDPHVLDARLRALVTAMRRIDWQTGRLLRLFLDCRLYRILGFPTEARYVRERLGLSSRKARMLVALERKTWEAPALMEAYRTGRLSCLQGLTLAPIISDRHGEAWVARAGEVTLRRLADEVAWALDVQDSSVGFAWVAPPAPGTPLVAPERQMRAWQDETPGAGIRFRGPASVIALLRSAIAAFHAPFTPGWVGLVGLLAHVTEVWESQPRHRDPVFARDGWRCSVPACSSRSNLHDHHIRFRSHGGGNERENRIAICAAHHLHGIHAGWVRAAGAAPAAVSWELGMRADGPPLARLVGDRYLEGGPGMQSGDGVRGESSHATVPG